MDGWMDVGRERKGERILEDRDIYVSILMG